MPKNPPWTPEQAREAGRLGGAEKARRRAEKAENPVLAVTAVLPELFQDLLKAARGQAPFHELAPDKRLAALFKALEYGAGRPSTAKVVPAKDEDETDTEPQSISIT